MRSYPLPLVSLFRTVDPVDSVDLVHILKLASYPAIERFPESKGLGWVVVVVVVVGLGLPVVGIVGLAQLPQPTATAVFAPWVEISQPQLELVNSSVQKRLPALEAVCDSAVGLVQPSGAHWVFLGEAAESLVVILLPSSLLLSSPSLPVQERQVSWKVVAIVDSFQQSRLNVEVRDRRCSGNIRSFEKPNLVTNPTTRNLSFLSRLHMHEAVRLGITICAEPCIVKLKSLFSLSDTKIAHAGQ